MSNLFDFDNALKTEYNIIAGCDEAGRGPLCGPVCCASVILKDEFYNEELNDSKKINEKKREELYDIIINNCLSYSVIFVDEKTIDEENILNASLNGMNKAVKQLDITPDIVLFDGNKLPKDIKLTSKAIVKGDSTSASIAAASILAKVSRDRYMKELSKKYPLYLLDKHKGYPTKQHYELLEKYGIPNFYRKSFFKKRQDLLWIKNS